MCAFLLFIGSFFSTKPSVSVPSPTTTSTSPTASMYTISNSRFIPTETSTANSSTENSSTENPPSTTAKTSAALAGTVLHNYITRCIKNDVVNRYCSSCNHHFCCYRISYNFFLNLCNCLQV